MPQCYLCQDITSQDTDPCPNDPPCEGQNICNYRVIRCGHKAGARRLVAVTEAARTAALYDSGPDDYGFLTDEQEVMFMRGFAAGVRWGESHEPR